MDKNEMFVRVFEAMLKNGPSYPETQAMNVYDHYLSWATIKSQWIVHRAYHPNREPAQAFPQQTTTS
jgi:hypothetical protein